MSDTIEPIAVFTDYRDLVVALRHRIVELGTHMSAVDEVAGLPARYTSKVLSLGQGRPTLGLISMGPILGALGLKLAVLPDDEALARIRHRLPKRSRNGPKLDDGARIAPAEQIAPAE
jgi:DNA-binding phage protein